MILDLWFDTQLRISFFIFLNPKGQKVNLMYVNMILTVVSLSQTGSNAHYHLLLGLLTANQKLKLINYDDYLQSSRNLFGCDL